MFSNELIEHVGSHTNLYATQHGCINPPVSQDEMHVVLGVLLLSGYCRVPYRELYWADSPDVHNEAVSKSISRNRFREIFRFLHLRDNLQISDDIYYKVRPLFEFLNENFKKFTYSSTYSIDESIIPYYGKHGTKQFIRGKPIRLGFKLWCITTSDGYLIHAEPYCGSDTGLDETSLGQGPDVVLGLLEKANVTEGSTITFDNLFTTLPLLDEGCA